MQGGDLPRVKELIGAQPTDFFQYDIPLLKSLTQLACMEGHLEILRYFVKDHKLDINATTTVMREGSLLCMALGSSFVRVPLGSSLLQLSIAHDRSHSRIRGEVGSPNTFACMEWLVSAGAEVDWKNSEGEDAWATACRAKHLPALAVLILNKVKDWSEVKHAEAPWHQNHVTGAAWYPVVGPSRDVSHLPTRSGQWPLQYNWTVLADCMVALEFSDFGKIPKFIAKQKQNLLH